MTLPTPKSVQGFGRLWPTGHNSVSGHRLFLCMSSPRDPIDDVFPKETSLEFQTEASRSFGRRKSSSEPAVSTHQTCERLAFRCAPRHRSTRRSLLIEKMHVHPGRSLFAALVVAAAGTMGCGGKLSIPDSTAIQARPSISEVNDQEIDEGGSKTVAFTIGDRNAAPTTRRCTAASLISATGAEGELDVSRFSHPDRLRPCSSWAN